MKSYDETINTVFDRIAEYKTAQKRKKKIITRTVVPACCIALAAMIGIGVWQSDVFKPKPSVSLEDSTVIGEKDYIGPDELEGNTTSDIDGTFMGTDQTSGHGYGPGQEPPPDGVTDSTSSASDTANDPCKLMSYINQIDSISSADIAPPQPVSEHYAQNWDNDKAIEFLDIDLSILNEKFNLESYNHTAWYKKSDNTLVWDLEHFAYSNEKTKFEISASKTFEPHDCIVVPTGEVISTMIGTKNGSVYVNFFGTVGTEALQQPETQDVMIAEFQHKDIYFRVKANDVSPFDFYQIVSAIVNG